MVLMIQYNLTITTTSDQRVFCMMYGHQYTIFMAILQGFVGLLLFIHFVLLLLFWGVLMPVEDCLLVVLC